MTAETLEPTAKQLVTDAVARLPDTATLDDIREELAILASIQEGLADIAAGRVYTHEEVMRESAPWTSR